MTCPRCQGYGCLACGYQGSYAATLPVPKAAAPKVGELYAGRCKRCRGESLRVSKVLLDKLELFCKLCGKEQEANR